MIQYRKYLSSLSDPFYSGALFFKWKKDKDRIYLFFLLPLRAFKYEEFLVHILVCLFFKFTLAGSRSMTDAVSA